MLVHVFLETENKELNVAWNLWKFEVNFWNCEAPSFTLNIIITHYRWPTTFLFLVNIRSPSHLWTSYATVIQFLHSLHFGRKPRTVHYGFLQHSCLAWRKRTAAQISQLAGLSIVGHIITHSVRTRTSTRWQVMRWFTRQKVIRRYLACGNCPPLSISYLK
jgi:hypothetical protein